MNTKKKRSLRRSKRLLAAKKQKLPPPELSYEMWFYIANSIQIIPLRDILKQAKAWTTDHPLFLALRDSMHRRLNHVLDIVNFQKLSLYPLAKKNDLLIDGFKKSYPLLIKLLQHKEQRIKLIRAPFTKTHQHIHLMRMMAGKFIRLWLHVIFEENPALSLSITGARSGADLPAGGKKDFWDETHLFSFELTGFFLRYHFDFHLKVHQGAPRKLAQIFYCFPGKWKCRPSCGNRRWATWSLLELRARIDHIVQHGLAWLFRTNTKRLLIPTFERYYLSPLTQEPTFRHVYVGAGSARLQTIGTI